MDKILLIKYGEIILKGLNRPIFEEKLINNLRITAGDRVLKIWKAQAIIYVQPKPGVDEDELALLLSKVFGVVSVAVAHVVAKEMGQIVQIAAKLMSATTAKTFKVEAKRSDKRFALKSPEICAVAGENILNACPHLTVDVINPEIVVTIEIRDSAAYIYTAKITGVGGMPIGTNGKALLLLSGGIDSPVAGYMIAKRGVQLCAVHFFSYPYTSERAREKVLDLAQKLTGYCGSITVYIVPFTDALLEIRQKCPDQHLTIIMRRLMMYVANKIAEKVKATALITGESIGQVASQTLEALTVTDDAAEYPVFRPLIGLDKEEIVQIARKIGTFETSILPYEDCCTVFTPKHPSTKPQLDKIIQSEQKLDVDTIISNALDGVEEIVLKR
ncbi:MAG: tRNA 4-thiouridine(8) synthase ThiI [Clostridiaceae bacterium]|nr:tRNA 4-thiouridine(8) synthase ThiI [Clostridiaceae bacterium]